MVICLGGGDIFDGACVGNSFCVHLQYIYCRTVFIANITELTEQTFEINLHESDIDFEKRVVPVKQKIEILPHPQSL